MVFGLACELIDYLWRKSTKSSWSCRYCKVSEDSIWRLKPNKKRRILWECFFEVKWRVDKKKWLNYTVYNKYYLATTMEVLATPLPPQPNRSLSYNDLKKRRLQRSNSHKKITIPHQQSTQVKRRHLTEQKSLINHLPRNEKALMNAIG